MSYQMTPPHAPGVPQGKHPHRLLGGGVKALENLSPGFGNELMRAGAEPMEPGLDMLYEIPCPPAPERRAFLDRRRGPAPHA